MSFLDQQYQVCTACGGTGDPTDEGNPFCVVCFGSGNEPIFDERRFAFARFLTEGERAPSMDRREGGVGGGGKSNGNAFANKFGGKCFHCGQWVEERAGICTRDGQKWVVQHGTNVADCPTPKPAAERPTPKATSLDLSGIPSGTYAVPGGDTRLKVQIDNVTKGKWAGWVFVKDAAEYGQQQRYGSQKPGATYQGKIEDALTVIMADPKAAMAAYGHLVGRCGVCNRKLEDKDSVERGIGPICEAKFG